jgi:hypothetical protein
MYANNGKISNRQLFRLYVFDLIGISTLLIPPILAKLSGIDGIFAILIGGGMGLGYLWYLGVVLKKMNTDLSTYLNQRCFTWVRKMVYFYLFIHGALTGGFIAYVFANLMQYSLVREVPYILLLFVTIVVAAYSVSGGVENRARIYEVLFWVILIPYVIMMIMGLKDIEVVYMNHFLESETMDLLKSSGLVFVFLTPLCFILFLAGKTTSTGKENYGLSLIKTLSKAVVAATVILLGSYVILYGNFGKKALETMKFPVITLMSTVQLKGNFLKRMDALMLAVWFFTLLALLNLHIHFGVKGLNKMAKSKRKRVATFDMGKMEIMAPIKSYHLDNYKNRTDKVVDYSCGEERKPDLRYVFFYDGKQKVIFEPNQEMVKAIQTIAPRKVFRD